jgi:hypothetical protein
MADFSWIHALHTDVRSLDGASAAPHRWHLLWWLAPIGFLAIGLSIGFHMLK